MMIELRPSCACSICRRDSEDFFLRFYASRTAAPELYGVYSSLRDGRDVDENADVEG